MTERNEPEVAPEATLDEMERRVLGATQDQERTTGDTADGADGADPASAFDIDLEPGDQGTAAAADEGSG